MEQNRCQVTAVIASYNPDLIKLKRTIISIAAQKDVSVQIILTDDGSANNYFLEAEAFLKSLSFTHYKFISSESNQGTVKNIYKALPFIEGEYVKTISPGDYLYQANTLSRWYSFTKQSNAYLSFGDAIYYFEDQGKLKYDRVPTHPMDMDVYSENQDPERIRNRYIIASDITLGAALLCKTDLVREYMDQIVGKVTYAEDNIYRIMHADGIAQQYCGFPVVWYESNSGISTGKSKKWTRRLQDDWRATDQIIIEKKPTDHLERRFQSFLMFQNESGIRSKFAMFRTFPELIPYMIQNRIQKKEHLSVQSADETFYKFIKTNAGESHE